MINAISSWTKSLILAIIVATILEMVIPEGKNKKYIKTVIGIYIVYTILSPILNIVGNSKVDINTDIIDKYMNTSQYTTTNTYTVDENINETYIYGLKSNIKQRLKEKGYDVESIDINAELNNQDEYGNIKNIKLHVKKTDSPKEISAIEKIQISLKKDEETINNESLSEIEKNELKNYLSDTYNVNKNNIDIGG